MRGPKAMLRAGGSGVKWVLRAPVRAYRSVVAWRRERPRNATRVFAGAAAVLTALSVLFALLHVHNVRTDSARTEARAVAEEVVPKLLSYDHRSLTEEMDARAAHVGGKFREDYLGLVRDIVIPASDREQLVTQTSTAAVGTAEDAGPARVQVMMFLNQTSTRAGQPKPTLSGSRVRATMENDDGHWILSALDPV